MEYHKGIYETKTKKLDDLEIRRIKEILKDSSKLEAALKYLQFFFGVFLNPYALYAFAKLGFAILGIYYHYFFFSFHLIEVITSQTVLVNVLLSIYIPIYQFFFIYMFFIVLMYFFSMFIYAEMYDNMPDGSCDSILICLSTLYTQTFTVRFAI